MESSDTQSVQESDSGDIPMVNDLNNVTCVDDNEDDSDEEPIPIAKRRRPSCYKISSGIDEPATRSIGTSPMTKESRYVHVDEDDDEGMLCNICMDIWHLSGEHRLVALKCGHLFGDSCIRRWIKSSPENGESKRTQRNCPQCKSRASPKDIFPLYARRVRVLDNTIEMQLREQLQMEKELREKAETNLTSANLRCARLNARCNGLECRVLQLTDDLHNTHMQMKKQQKRGNSSSDKVDADNYSERFKLALDHQFVVQRSAGCRVLKYSPINELLIISNHSTNPVFNNNNYGVCFYDTRTFTYCKNIVVGPKVIRDISLDKTENCMAITCIDHMANLYDIRTSTVCAKFKSDDTKLWSCCFDLYQENHNINFGSAGGICYAYDIRKPNYVVKHYETDDNGE